MVLPLPVNRRVAAEEISYDDGGFLRSDKDLLDVLRGLLIVLHGVGDQTRIGLYGR